VTKYLTFLSLQGNIARHIKVTKRGDKMSDKLSKIGLPIYKTNPSVKQAIENTKTGVKRISNTSGNEMIIASKSTGEIVTGVDVGFHQRVKVDKTQFVKLYIQGVTAFTGLSKTGAKVLEMVIAEAHKNTGKDLLWLSAKEAEIFGIADRTFKRGMKELRQRGILFDCDKGSSWYFINVNYMFNGDRLAFLKTYELEKEGEEEETVNQPSLPFVD